MASTGTLLNPEPADTKAIEPKTAWGTIAFYLAGVVGIALTDAFTANDNALLLDALPDPIEWFVLPLVPAAVGFVTQFYARHQWRRAEIVSRSSATQPGGKVA